MFENTWNRIVEWFKDHGERDQLVRSFNENARRAFICGDAPTVLKASISHGCSAYRHEFSSWINTGFRIQVLTGRLLSRDEIIFIGQVILSNEVLVRRLVVLGWDTLEIHGDRGCYGCRWKLTDYANIGRFIEQR